MVSYDKNDLETIYLHLPDTNNSRIGIHFLCTGEYWKGKGHHLRNTLGFLQAVSLYFLEKYKMRTELKRIYEGLDIYVEKVQLYRLTSSKYARKIHYFQIRPHLFCISVSISCFLHHFP